jgi:asparagine N-glycosylation enzyme membrane subunit Stt3
MDILGLFCLGCFLGSIAVVGLRFMNTQGTWVQGLATTITATLSGTAVLFIKEFHAAIGAYPIGLLIALLWVYVPDAITKISSSKKTDKAIGWLHLVGVVVVNFVAAAIVVPPAWSEVLKH